MRSLLQDPVDHATTVTDVSGGAKLSNGPAAPSRYSLAALFAKIEGR